MSHRSAPQLGFFGRRLELTDLEQFERAHDALAVGWLDLSRRPRRALGEGRVERSRPASFELSDPAFAYSLRRGGLEAQVGQRRSEVKAGAPDHDRALPGEQQTVDLGVRKFGVLACAEGSVDGEKRDQTVLQARAFVGACSSG